MPGKSSPQEAIAIVGSACRFAGDATSTSKLWDLLKEPKDVQSKIPDSRYSVEGFYHPDGAHHGHANVKHAYLVSQDTSLFDAEFFGINGMESKAMDPQQRMLLEVVYESIEDAGMTIDGLRGSDTAVYAGIMSSEYEAMFLQDLDNAPTYMAAGVGRSILTNRISYIFDWHGASITLDTACSSSLVAVHQAVQALRTGESRMALACGTNLVLGPMSYIVESKVKMLSPEGRCRMWDKDANGYVRGDGIAVVLLKTLSAALQDGDTIHCLIRETGLSQDGATPGLTMPSPSSQRELIQRTYAKAGLDPFSQKDQPQYFEAHGTGTPAGDPVECEAIQTAFFGKGGPPVRDHPLYCGSIKTVLGHTEGTAGIAGILKAMLAMKHSVIPPNLLFNNLSPSVAPFYDGLEILRAPRAWPELRSQPKRVSVNSFGFGGTNAHAILESFQTPSRVIAKEACLFTPFVFSAASAASLRASLEAYASYVDEHPETNVPDLAYTLYQRRSVFPFRAVFPSSTLQVLSENIRAQLENQEGGIGVRASTKAGQSPRLLGIFTGQGAQYAQMGLDLIQDSKYARRVFDEFDAYLAQLPSEDRPDWSLRGELCRESSASRINEAAVSQPLCTAIQILLITLLKEANILFDAVVGHSSGEIAAAYAAGFLTARDAICIAYYRGLHCSKTTDAEAKKGAMLAVGTSMEDALELCAEEEFVGRVTVAACNSSSSVTISGDEDAILELQVILEDEKKFNRRLRVDKAYHSHHMVPCYGPYVKSLRRVGVKAQKPSASHCTWFSSVYHGQPVGSDFELNDVYWAENMIKPVLFSQALSAAISQGVPYDLALEIGPHPSLQGPASQTIQDCIEKPLPYHGTLYRGSNSIEALSSSLGFLWSHLKKDSVQLHHFQSLLAGQEPDQFCLVQGLPTYCWKHDTKHWHESRRSRKVRLRQKPFHPLLGHPSPDSAPHHRRWDNILKPTEIPWLNGHQLQNQIVFPAAGYVSTAFEAAIETVQSLGGGPKNIRLLEVSDFTIHHAITFEDENTGVEVLVELSQISSLQASEVLARFTYSAASGGEDADLTLAADGNVKIYLGDASLQLLPERPPTPTYLISTENDRLYRFLEGMEYNFTGAFRSLHSVRRKLGRASCQVNKALTDDNKSVLIHPIDLDAVFQSVLLAYSYPGDDQLRVIHLPSSVSRIRVNPAILQDPQCKEDCLAIESTCTRSDRFSSTSGFSGSVNVYATRRSSAAIQVDQVGFRPLGTSATQERNVFYRMNWVPSIPDGITAAKDILITQDDRNLVPILNRIAAYYLRKFDREVPEDSPVRREAHLCHYLHYARVMVNLYKTGQHEHVKEEWENDSFEDIMAEVEANNIGDSPNAKILILVGETMPRVFRGETTMLEHLRMSGLLDEYYAQGLGTMQSSLWLGHTVKQITDRHPHLSILEIGAGTGGATKNVLKAVGQSFNQYTFTDISSSFFENAAEIFSPWKSKMSFRVCDAEKDPVAQGFTEGGYDVIIASFVIHATASLDDTMRNIRRLLKPGGFLVVGEGSREGALKSADGFIFGTLPGWWLGVPEGRDLSPFVDASEWNEILLRTGFSSFTTVSPPGFLETFGMILFVAQAIDDKISFIRSPLTSPTKSSNTKLIIIGGETKPVRHLVDGIKRALYRFTDNIITYKTLEEVEASVCDENATVISLSELDEPIFKKITPEKWYSFRRLFTTELSMFWVTSGRLAEEPFSNMVVGFGRSAANEVDGLRLQFMDIADVSKADAQDIAERFCRFQDRHLEDGSILYTAEPEILVDENGSEYVARLQPIAAANDRYNSIQRPISHPSEISKTNLELCQDGEEYKLRHISRYEGQLESTGDETVELRTTLITASAVKTLIGHKFVVVGADASDGYHVSLASSLRSTFRPLRESIVSCHDLGLSPEASLALAATTLVSMAIIDTVLTGHEVLVHNASDFMALVLSTYASIKGVRVIFTTDAQRDVSSFPMTRLSPFLGKSDLYQVIPKEVSCFAGMSNNTSENESAIISMLPPQTRIETAQTLYLSTAVNAPLPQVELFTQTLKRMARNLTDLDFLRKTYAYTITDLESLAAAEQSQGPLKLREWETFTAALSVQAKRLDTKTLFKPDKTYWLCGMSGALGISLCDWMIDRGVRFLVLTSRKPNIEPSWLEAHKQNGIVIRILPCDVTDEQALRTCRREIVETLPPVAGVLNGAMVLRDVSIHNMEIDHVLDVIGPKVFGSIHLDRIFHDINLDFFILMSSINCVVGTAGQANYGAANMGLCAIAAQRRKRGLNSSCINLGTVLGAGYMTESNRQLEQVAEKLAMMHLSEDDFHQIFAEGMEAGYLDSPEGPEISTGLLSLSPDSGVAPRWCTDPKFANLVIRDTAESASKGEQAVVISIQDQLRDCRSDQDIIRVTNQTFSAQLRKILQKSATDEEILSMDSTSLGLDSLISVDIRSWFLKNFQVNIPVLKIMSSEVQMASLAELAAASVPASLVPQVRGSEGSAAHKDEDSENAVPSSEIESANRG